MTSIPILKYVYNEYFWKIFENFRNFVYFTLLIPRFGSQEPMPKILAYNELMKEVPESFRARALGVSAGFPCWLWSRSELFMVSMLD